jgi:hypothetical protein
MSRWLFFPSPSVAGVKIQYDYTISSASGVSWNTTVVWGGTDDVSNNYETYPSGSLRTQPGYIELLFYVQAGGDYATAGAWETAVTNAGNLILTNSTWTHEGSTLAATSVGHTYGSDAGTVPRVRWFAASPVITSFWNFSVGETGTITMDWA